MVWEALLVPSSGEDSIGAGGDELTCSPSPAELALSQVNLDYGGEHACRQYECREDDEHCGSWPNRLEELPDHPGEAHAAQDKARYEAEMTTYVPPPGYDATGNLVEDRRLNKKYMKKHKDPEQPKRARGSFVFFTFDMRPKVMEEYPGIKFVDMGVVLGERWRALPAGDKSKYEEMAQEDKQRFNKEMEEYSAKRVAAEPPAPVIPDNRAYAQQAAANAQAAASHAAATAAAAAYHPDPHYDHAAAAAAHHAYYADPNAAYYADPNAQADPYGQHAMYYQQGQQYHYA